MDCPHGCDKALEFAILTAPDKRDAAMVASSRPLGLQRHRLRRRSRVPDVDEEAIFADLESGAATAIMAGLDEGDGADLYMAIYPDGRGFSWRLPNDKYEE